MSQTKLFSVVVFLVSTLTQVIASSPAQAAVYAFGEEVNYQNMDNASEYRPVIYVGDLNDSGVAMVREVSSNRVFQCSYSELSGAGAVYAVGRTAYYTNMDNVSEQRAVILVGDEDGYAVVKETTSDRVFLASYSELR